MTQPLLIMLCTDKGSITVRINGSKHSCTVLNGLNYMARLFDSFVPRWPWWPNQSCASLLSSSSIYYWLIYNVCKSDPSGNRLKVPFAVTRHILSGLDNGSSEYINLRPIHGPRDKSIFFLEYYAPCVRYLIDFLCIILRYNEHFMRRKCIYLDWRTVQQNIL